MHEELHPAAEAGFAAGADRYARGRPDFPPAITDWLRERLGLGPGRLAVELGAGTGKFTPRILATGAGVVAVEPVDAMLARLAADLPLVDARHGTAAAIPLPDASADAVVCAQSFHWFATREALQEICRVLKPGGRLALVWNVRDMTIPWMQRISAIIAPFEAGVPRQASGAWRTVFPFHGLGPLEEDAFVHLHSGTVEQVVVERTLSISFIAALPPEQQRTVLAELRAMIAANPDLAGAGRISVPYRTLAYSCVRLPVP